MLIFRARLDELRMFLENEAWELCPVKPSFSILMLQVSHCYVLMLYKVHTNRKDCQRTQTAKSANIENT